MRMTMMLGLTLLLAAGAAAGDAKSDLAKLQGQWIYEKEGKKAELQFTKSGFTIKLDSEEFKGTFKIDASKKPKQMDLTIVEGKKFTGETALAIYDLDGDSLKWCTSKPGKGTRATEFPPEAGGDGEVLYIVLKRVKD